jgi:hypothetical protein
MVARVNKPLRANQVIVGFAVMGLHLVGALLWWTADRTMQWVNSSKRPASVTVWLPTPSTPPADTTHVRRQAVQGTPGLPRQSDGARLAPGVVAQVKPAPGTDDIPLPAPLLIPSDTPHPSTPTLNLSLPSKAIASIAPPSFAEQSPFRGRLPATVERQIASAAAESGPWTEERIDNDHIRFRRGNTCVTMERPRAAAIDPFSEAMARIPWRASPPGECH